MRNKVTKRVIKKDNKKTKKVIVFILIGLVLIISVLAIIFRSNIGLPKPKPTPVYLEDEGYSLDGEVKTKSREDILKELENQQLVVTDKLSSNITFSSGQAGISGNWIVENLEENNIIQQAEVYFGELLIAKSTPIYPNQHIEAVELLKDVESGEYDVIAYINYYDIETKEFISKAGYKVHLTVD